MLHALALLAAISNAGPHAGAAPRVVRIVPGTSLRVSSPAMAPYPVEGEAIALDRDTLVLRFHPRETNASDPGSAVVGPVRRDSVLKVPADRIMRLEIMRAPGQRASTGAKIGGVVGGLCGLGLGAMIASDPFLGSSAGGATIFIFGAASGLAGAGVGALIGAIPGTGRWHTLAPADVRDAFARAAADSAAARPAPGASP